MRSATANSKLGVGLVGLVALGVGVLSADISTTRVSASPVEKKRAKGGHPPGKRGGEARLVEDAEFGRLFARRSVKEARLVEDAELGRLFARRSVKGTMVLASLDGDRAFVHDVVRARRRLIPASTFKIPNSLIALEMGAVLDEGAVIRWDGLDRGRPEWNRDHTLASAFRVSCVWCYQVLARRIGVARYRDLLGKLGYGDARVGKNPAVFWLDGTLTISAVEQVRFLRRLVRRQLPFRAAVYDAVARIMVLERGPGFVIRAKTGWSTESRPAVGWLVGTVEGRRTWLFAMNIDLPRQADAYHRQALTREALQIKGIVPGPP